MTKIESTIIEVAINYLTDVNVLPSKHYNFEKSIIKNDGSINIIAKSPRLGIMKRNIEIKIPSNRIVDITEFGRKGNFIFDAGVSISFKEYLNAKNKGVLYDKLVNKNKEFKQNDLMSM